MNLEQLIKFYRNKMGLSKSQFADMLGVSRMSVNRWENGEVKSVNDETLQKLSDILGIDVSFYIESSLVKPLLGNVRAGYDLLAIENIEEFIEVSSLDANKGDYFLRVVGDSMTGSHIYPGNLVFIKQVEDVQSGDIAIVMIGEEVTLKRVIKKENLLILEATNPVYENRYYTPKEVELIPVQIIGRVLYTKVDFT